MEEEKTARRKPPVTKYEETPDDLYIVEKTYTEAEEELIKFVEKKIAQMNESLLFNGDSLLYISDRTRLSFLSSEISM